jgi:hypothetical protein
MPRTDRYPITGSPLVRFAEVAARLNGVIVGWADGQPSVAEAICPTCFYVLEIRIGERGVRLRCEVCNPIEVLRATGLRPDDLWEPDPTAPPY